MMPTERRGASGSTVVTTPAQFFLISRPRSCHEGDVTVSPRDRWSWPDALALALALAMCAACGFSSPRPSEAACTAASVSCASETVLRTCAAEGAAAEETECAWGCMEAEAAHCGAPVPAGGGPP